MVQCELGTLASFPVLNGSRNAFSTAGWPCTHSVLGSLFSFIWAPLVCSCISFWSFILVQFVGHDGIEEHVLTVQDRLRSHSELGIVEELWGNYGMQYASAVLFGAVYRSFSTLNHLYLIIWNTSTERSLAYIICSVVTFATAQVIDLSIFHY